MVKEVEKVYGMEGVEMEDKEVEVMVREMLGKVGMIECGDSKVLGG
nr:hypothetical protein [Staphylococcus auricularis]